MQPINNTNIYTLTCSNDISIFYLLTSNDDGRTTITLPFSGNSFLHFVETSLANLLAHTYSGHLFSAFFHSHLSSWAGMVRSPEHSL